MSSFKKNISLLLCLILVLSISACSRKNNNAQNQSTLGQTTVASTQAMQSTIATTTGVTTTKVLKTDVKSSTKSDNVQKTTEWTRKFYKSNQAMRNITSAQLLNEINIGINIGNSLDSVGLGKGAKIEMYEQGWGNPKVTNDLIKAYKKAGFRLIRLPVTWYEHIEDGTNKVDEKWLERVEEVVDMILDNGMYCILNTHHEQNWLNTNQDNQVSTTSKFINLWEQIANRFKNYDDHLLFESFNEILKGERDWSSPELQDIKNVNTLNQFFVSTVRGTKGNNSKRHLIVNTYGAGFSGIGVTEFRMPKDKVKDRLIAQVHMYTPGDFALEGTQKEWEDENTKELIKSQFGILDTFFVEQNIPLIIGEFGATDSGNTKQRASYSKFVVKLARQRKIVCVWWDNGTDFGLIDRHTYKLMFPTIIDALIKTAN